MNIEFNSINDLYKRVLPALAHTKRKLHKKGIKLNEKEIFKELTKKWSTMQDLTLSDIVNDIISFDEYFL